MTVSLWMLFATAIVVASVSPGPNVLIVMINALKYGGFGAFWTIAGNLLCLFCIAILASIGVGTAIATAPLAYQTMKVAGGLYLVWIGFKMIRASLAPLNELHVARNDTTISDAKSIRLMSEAFLVSAGNPKAILFLSAIFPQFLDPVLPIVPQFVIMFTTIIVIVAIVHGTYGLLAVSFRQRPLSDRAQRWMARIAGGTFIGLGAGVVTTN